MKVVIVGGVAGGATAAARLRRLDEQAEIVVFERSGFVSYANCGLPYYIGDVITAPEELTLQTPESFFRPVPCEHEGPPRGEGYPPGQENGIGKKSGDRRRIRREL